MPETEKRIETEVTRTLVISVVATDHKGRGMGAISTDLLRDISVEEAQAIEAQLLETSVFKPLPGAYANPGKNPFGRKGIRVLDAQINAVTRTFTAETFDGRTRTTSVEVVDTLVEFADEANDLEMALAMLVMGRQK